jgi:Flp pilus assembly protein TadD
MAFANSLHRNTTLESQGLFDLALEKIKRNHFREALGHLMNALRIAPANPSYRSYFGYCLAQSEGDFDRAIRFCRQASESRPMDPVLHVNLGKVYRLKGDNASAHNEFLYAWEVCAGHPLAAAELTRMGVRRPPVISRLPRSHWCNKYLGRIRAAIERRLSGPTRS